MDVMEDGPGAEDHANYGELSREAENTEERRDKDERRSQTQTERK